jgi:hypothetical protein
MAAGTGWLAFDQFAFACLIYQLYLWVALWK